MPRFSSRTHRAVPFAALALTLLALPACSTSASSPSPDAEPSASFDGHGIDAGAAAEVAAPALALVIADADGEVTLLDLASEERSVIGEALPDVGSVESDGRLVYVTHADGDRSSVDVIDTARWTVPHGDHSHSLQGEPRLIGTLDGDGDGDGDARITAGAQRATVHFADGDLVLLPHDELSGDLAAAPRLPLDATGSVVPFADHLLVPTTDAAIEVLDTDGAPVTGAATPCTAPADADITRVGAVIACAEGAVLFTREVGGAIRGAELPVPDGPPAPTALAGRADRPDLAGVAGDRGAWLLDVRQRQWTLLPSDVPLLRAVAVGDDDSRTVAIDVDGRVRVLSSDGTVIARTDPLLAASVADPALRERLQLVVDATHAYVTDPASGSVHEIDHDDGVVTRSFTDLDPWFLAQVG